MHYYIMCVENSYFGFSHSITKPEDKSPTVPSSLFGSTRVVLLASCEVARV
jgi:hypothetical protein